VRGLRVQIVLALAGLLVLAFVPLYGALAASTRTALESGREDTARSLGRAIAAHAADTKDEKAMDAVLRSHVGAGGAIAIAVFGKSGNREATAGELAELSSIVTPQFPFGEGTRINQGTHGRVLDVTVPRGDLVVVARVRLDDEQGYGSSLVRLFALYTFVFGAALLTFAYFALTRLIVRPIESLADAADRVARGASNLEVPRTGASELLELGESLKRMTRELMNKEEALRKKIAELSVTTSTLSDARFQLEGSERLASVGRLAAGVAHEIGNPITAMMGMQDLLLSGDLPQDTEKDFLERMRKETERVHTIIRDLLDFSRTQKEPTSSESGSIEIAVESAVALLRPQKGMKDIEIITVVPESFPAVSLSTNRLTQILLNLLINARDAVEEVKGATIRITASQVDSRAIVAIEDNGSGISQALTEKIFQPFFTTKEVGEGTGLGLSVCRGLAESAGGTLTVDASHTQGARLVLALPLR
jgi:two-component system, NtrC family, sensor kinase